MDNKITLGDALLVGLAVTGIAFGLPYLMAQGVLVALYVWGII